MVDNFFKVFALNQHRKKATDSDHEQIGGSLPRFIHDLWDEIGFGKAGDGIFEFINPLHYQEAFARFFGGDAAGRTPFLLTGLGELIAYKRISPREGEISILHTYGPNLNILAYDLDDFFDRILMTDDGLRQVINVPLFNAIKGTLPVLRSGSIYGFDPIVLQEMPKGSRVDESYFEVQDAQEHLQLLYTRAAD